MITVAGGRWWLVTAAEFCDNDHEQYIGPVSSCLLIALDIPWV